jgi:1,2-diacylglycerol 3-alpha-glucosyltransferase
MKNKQTVFLVCTGLGHINRGFESFSRECFDELKQSDDFGLYLLKGGGRTQNNEIAVWNLARNGKGNKILRKLTGKDAYYLEQLSFFLGMLPTLFGKRPSLIYYSDFLLGTFLWNLRQRLRLNYRLLFSNGAPNGPPFTRTDHIHQLLPVYLNQAIVEGTQSEIQTVLPYAISVNKEKVMKEILEIHQLREELQLPLGKKIIISVGAINSFHKRMDYLVSEFSLLDKSKYYLVLLGQIDADSSSILNIASETLDSATYRITQVSQLEVNKYLVASDYFVLASLNEGLPRVLPEALCAGLLPIVHDYVITRETLKEYGVYLDLTLPGKLAEGINEVDKRNVGKTELVGFGWAHFSWQQLGSQYQAMIKKNLG